MNRVREAKRATAMAGDQADAAPVAPELSVPGGSGAQAPHSEGATPILPPSDERSSETDGSSDGGADLDSRARRDGSKSGKARDVLHITPRALDLVLRNVFHAYGRFENVPAAYEIGVAQSLNDIAKRGNVIELRPRTAMERHLDKYVTRTRGSSGFAMPTGETPHAAARRREWDDAKRKGDPGAMTRTANALLRAVEDARAYLGEAERSSEGDGGRDSISEILNPLSGARLFRPPERGMPSASAPRVR